MVSTVAGKAGDSGSFNGVGNAARFSYPTGLAADGNGVVYVADRFNNSIRKLSPAANAAPVVTLVGNDPLTFEASANYSDSGAIATDAEDGALIPVITHSTVLSSQPGSYSVRWTATDSVGFTGTAGRLVNVVDTHHVSSEVDSGRTARTRTTHAWLLVCRAQTERLANAHPHADPDDVEPAR